MPDPERDNRLAGGFAHDAQLRGEWPNEPAVREFHEQVVAARRAIGM